MSPSGDRGPEGALEVVRGADEDRIVVRAALDMSLAGHLQAAAAELRAGGGGRRLAVDLTETPFLDSSGVQALVRLAALAPPGFRVIAAGQPYQVLELTEVLQLLGVERGDAR